MAYRGVNIGGWLVAEKWMTRGLFQGVEGEGERAIGRELLLEEAETRIHEHRRSFITETDFVRIKQLGIDFVRLPFGYWLFEAGEGYTSGEEHLRDALAWTKKHGLGIVLDFHGLQGSQNGRDHSGEVMEVPGFYRGDNVKRALGTLAYVAKEYGQSDNLLGIEVINEPFIPKKPNVLLDYYEEAYRLVEEYTPDRVKVIVGDNFNHLEMHKWLQQRSFGPRVIHDIHPYQLFTKEEEAMSLEEHIHKVRNDWKMLLTKLGGKAMAGEWTPALPPRAVEGYDDAMGALKLYHDEQVKLFEKLTWGYAPWSWKAPDSAWWSYGDLPFITKHPE